MKNAKEKKAIKLNKLLCAVVRGSAYSGAGLKSAWGYYQPKVPDRILK